MPQSTRSRGVETVVATGTAAALCAGVWLLDHGTDRHTPPRPPAAHAVTTDPRPSAESVPELSPVPMSGRPERVRVPAIGVDAPLTGLGLTGDGALEAPPRDEGEAAGWYEDGTVPGDVGTALVAGHVDTAEGPAVFYRLGALKEGATVLIDRQDGLTATFVVDAVEVYEGPDFPDQRVYGPAARPEIRLITCGGSFDPEAGGYQGNVVVFAHLTGIGRTAEDDAP
ncbi:class F sortase [Streptomyces sp. JJ36]|uniref:class F sortase n=1 Tax=Streptomyces sp. JJ36 TaxID=2736645 RepID=UPI001F160911|nr:class F sortase [Streptomyces sp. JJ36]MCF6524817.1 class F sortase [Streptomyces sp. JJ36]